MTRFQILYWQDIPTQVKAWDEFDEAKREMPAGFMERVDREAQRQGLSRMEDYLSQLRRSEEGERAGEPEDVVAAVIQELQIKHTC